MQNSAQQAANVWGALAVDGRAVRDGPVLLVDDLVDSRWTLTVAGALLRDTAPGPVLPVRAGRGDASWRVRRSRPPASPERRLAARP